MKPARSLWRIWLLALLLAALLGACSTECQSCQSPDVEPEAGALGFRLCLTESPDSVPASNLCLDVTLAYSVTD